MKKSNFRQKILGYALPALPLIGLSSLFWGQSRPGLASDEASTEKAARAAAASLLNQPPDNVQVYAGSFINLKRTGAKLTRFKVRTKDGTGASTEVAIDEAGHVVDHKKLIAAEAAEEQRYFGKKTESLKYRVDHAAADEQVPVSLWLRVDESQLPTKPSIDGNTARLNRQRTTRTETKAAVKALLASRGQQVAAVHRAARSAYLPKIAKLDPAAKESPGAPMVYARLTRAQIEAASADEEVLAIDLADVETKETLGIASDTQNWVPEVHNNLGLRGGLVRVAQLESNGQVAAHPNLDFVNQINSSACIGAGGSAGHATAVAGVLLSSNAADPGVVPDAFLEAGGGCASTTTVLETDANTARTNGATVFNASYRASLSSQTKPGNHDRYYDSLFTNNWVSTVVAAGNEGSPCTTTGWTDGKITTPALGFNTLTVGNFNDNNSVTWVGDTMDSCSSWVNPASTNSDREKPEVSASGENIRTTNTSGGFSNKSGTSFAAPTVAGQAALMQDAEPTLMSWPEVIKAAIMATAHHNIEGASRLSDKDGAGAIDVNAAVRVVDTGTNGNWIGSPYMNCNSTWPWTTTISLVAGRRTRVAIAWHQSTNFSSYADRPGADLDLWVNFPGGGSTGSTSWDNTFEIVDFTPATTGTYQVEVKKHSCDDSPKWIGFVWYQLP